MSEPIEVVAAVIPGGDGTFLIAQRNSPHGFGKWEFPGGKVHEGESLKEAVVREIQEELGVVVTPINKIHEITLSLEWGTYHVTFFLCRFYHQSRDDFRGLEGQPIARIKPDRHKEFDTFEGDRQVFTKILADEGVYA